MNLQAEDSRALGCRGCVEGAFFFGVGASRLRIEAALGLGFRGFRGLGGLGFRGLGFRVQGFRGLGV